MTTLPDIRAKVQRYIDGVQDGSIPCCNLVRLAVARHVRDLEDAPERGFEFSELAAARAVRFYSFLRHSKGEWAGQVFELSDWQIFIVWCLFGWRRDADRRRFRTAYVEVPRKNGKSTLLAGIGLYLLDADNEPGAEVYTAATKRDQARIVHGEAVRMVKKSPALKARIKTLRDNLHVPETSSKFEPLGADSDTMDGLNVHGALVDELHAHKSRMVLDILDTATGSRRQPLSFRITTAGSDPTSVCGEEHDYAAEVLKGIRRDDTLFAFISTIDESDDWTKPQTWRKANPNFGISVKEDDLVAKCTKAQAMPSARNAFLRLHLNVWTQTDEVWIPLEKWDACKTAIDPTELIGKPCHGGLDLSSKLDLTTLVLAWRLDGGRYVVMPRFWIPEARLRDRRGHDDYSQWTQDGFLETTPGDVTDYAYIEAAIVEASQRYNLIDVAFDPWNATQTAVRLRDVHGITMVEFRQGYASMNEPAKEWEKLVTSRLLAHDGHPVMRWNMSNTAVQTDPSGNIKPIKPEHGQRKKIDGVVAGIMALGRWLVSEEEPELSYAFA